ncbi:hypothetical protein HK100_009309, partial [Physocladia obscura]
MRVISTARYSLLSAVTVSYGDAAEVGADAEHDEPLGVLDPVSVGLLVAQGGEVDGAGVGNVGGGAVADKDGLAAPLEHDVFALGNVGLGNLDLREGEHVGGGGQRRHEVDDNVLRDDGLHDAERADGG